MHSTTLLESESQAQLLHFLLFLLLHPLLLLLLILVHIPLLHRNVYKDQDQLQLISHSEEEVESWKASFLRAGVYPEAAKDSKIDDVRMHRAIIIMHHVMSCDMSCDVMACHVMQDPELASMDPTLERQVETIRNLVDSYIHIVIRTVKDQVPKAVMFMMVNKVCPSSSSSSSFSWSNPPCFQMKEYIKNDLLPMIYSAGDQGQLMEESQESTLRREEMIRMYHACKEALNIISEVSTRTGTDSGIPSHECWRASRVG